MDLLGEILGDALVLAVDSFVIGYFVRQLNKCNHYFNALQTAPVLDIDSSLKEEISKYPSKVIPYVVIRGIVTPLSKPISSITNPSITGVIQRLTIKEHVMERHATGFWSNRSETVDEVYNCTPFVLSSGKYKVEVVDALAAEVIDMDVISDKFEPMNPGLIQHVWGWLWGLKQRGVQSIEEVLRDGSYLTAVGELRDTSAGLKLQPPGEELPMYLTTRTKTSLLKKLSSSRDKLKVVLLITGALATFITVRLAYKILSRKKRKEEAESIKKQLAESRKERRAQNRDKDIPAEQRCVVCVENPKEIILLPCGHVCLCEDCSDQINDKCPICRNDIQSRLPAFIS